MKAIIVTTPYPACILNLADPARAYVASSHTDVAATWEQHKPIQYTLDDYDRVQQDDWLSAPGGFK